MEGEGGEPSIANQSRDNTKATPAAGLLSPTSVVRDRPWRRFHRRRDLVLSPDDCAMKTPETKIPSAVVVAAIVWLALMAFCGGVMWAVSGPVALFDAISSAMLSAALCCLTFISILILKEK